MIHPVGPSAGRDFVIGGSLLHNDRKHEVLWRLKVSYEPESIETTLWHIFS